MCLRLYSIYADNRFIFAAKYSAYQLVSVMSTLVPVKFSMIAVLPIQAQIFKSTYLRFRYRYADNSMRVILHICCQIQCTSVGWRYVNSGPCQIQRNCSFAYSGLNIQIYVSLFLMQI